MIRQPLELPSMLPPDPLKTPRAPRIDKDGQQLRDLDSNSLRKDMFQLQRWLQGERNIFEQEQARQKSYEEAKKSRQQQMINQKQTSRQSDRKIEASSNQMSRQASKSKLKVKQNPHGNIVLVSGPSCENMVKNADIPVENEKQISVQEKSETEEESESLD